MTPVRLLVLCLAFAGLTCVGPRADADDAGLTGGWIAKSEGEQVAVTFGPKDRITIVEKNAMGTATSHGRYRVQKNVIVVVLDGETNALRYPYTLAGGVLKVRDVDGTMLHFRRAGAKPATEKAPTKAGDCRRVTTYVPWIYTDRGGLKHPGTGQWLEAFRMWVPEGWRVQGGVRWKIHARNVHTIKRADLINPAVIEFTIEAPDGQAAITVYPGEWFTDLSGAPAAPMFPKGSKYGGTTVWPPLAPQAYVQQILLPRYFRRVTGARVVAYKNAPDLAAHFREEVLKLNRAVGATGVANLSLAAGITTVDFQAQGKAYREHFVTVPMYLRMPGMVMWWPRMAWSVRARKDCMAQLLPSLLTSIYSFRLNPWWFLLYQRIVDSNWKGVAAVDATIAKIDSAIVASRAKTASKIHRQLYPVLTGMATKAAPGYKPLPLDGMKNHAVDPQGRLRELPDGTNMNDLPPGWKPMKQVPVK